MPEITCAMSPMRLAASITTDLIRMKGIPEGDVRARDLIQRTVLSTKFRAMVIDDLERRPLHWLRDAAEAMLKATRADWKAWRC